jgi:UDP-N-acetylmuramoyl-tripeptide--D-alanyl-D-alanine ligase
LIRGLISLFRPSYIVALVYMLQSTEYQPRPYLKWYWRTNNFQLVARRRTLDRTRAASLLELALKLGIVLQILLAAVIFGLWLSGHLHWGWLLALSVLISYPIVWAHLVIIPLVLGRIFVATPREKRLIAESKNTFTNHKGIKIAVAGSYGKTSMKEMLATVLSHGKRVAVTPANKNVASSHAQFASSLTGDEDILVIEYGEGKPGDVKQFCETTAPTIGVITGIAPAHLDHYPTLDSAARDIFSLAEYLNNENVYVNGDSLAAKKFIKPSHNVYTINGIDGWKVKNIKVEISGTTFTLQSKNRSLKLKTQLVGRHHIGPLAAAAIIAMEVGLSQKQIEDGVAATKPFEHRMYPRATHGAWIIDDTYNGNIDGMRAGLALLDELPAKRKIYVTPGLVDQGVETEPVHVELGKLIARSNPDRVVLMKNSVTDFISKGMEEEGYKGEVRIEQDPLNFYLNIEHFVAAGDLVLMQNDWTDNYT